MGQVIKLHTHKQKHPNTVSVVDSSLKVHRVELEHVAYVGLADKTANLWEARVRHPNGGNSTMILPACEAILLLIKCAKEFGIDLSSNIA